jgi:5-methylcytosine-specific restriction endonuclease McrA
MRRSLSTKARAALFLDHKGQCHICGGMIQPGQAWEVEHVIPLAQGGDDEPHNMRPAHAKCHKAKTADDAANTAKAKRREAKHNGWRSPSKRPLMGSKASGWRKRMDGTVERR